MGLFIKHFGKYKGLKEFSLVKEGNSIVKKGYAYIWYAYSFFIP